MAYDVGGTEEAIINGETGILVAACDVGGLAKQLLLLAADRGLLAQMRAAAHTRVVEKCVMRDMVQRHEPSKTILHRGRPVARRSSSATTA